MEGNLDRAGQGRAVAARRAVEKTIRLVLKNAA
jgi:hypothetical protein